MSRTVNYVGRIKEIIPKEGETLQDFAKCRLSSSEQKKANEYWDGDLLACLEGNYPEDYVIVDNRLFGIIHKEIIDPDEDYFKGFKNPDKSISFDVRYYNGGCSFNEAIDEVLKEVEK
jgi:hypothetical protein